MAATLQNITARLKAFSYLHTSGLYNALHLRQLNQELEEIHQIVNEAHMQNPNNETHNLLSEVDIDHKQIFLSYFLFVISDSNYS